MSHPDRPDAADFWLMSEIVIANDETEDIEALLDAIAADKVSVYYMADNRSALMMRGIPMSATMHRKLRALWLDGFLLGAQFRQRKLEGEQ